jgi:hypothetical protein
MWWASEIEWQFLLNHPRAVSAIQGEAQLSKCLQQIESFQSEAVSDFAQILVQIHPK